MRTRTVPRAKVCEIEVEAARVSTTIVDPSLKTMRSEISKLRNTLQDVVNAMKTMQQMPSVNRPRRSSELTCYNCTKKGHLKKDCRLPTVCYGCRKPGHQRRDCPEAGSQSWQAAVRSQQKELPTENQQADVRTLQQSSERSSVPPQLVSPSPTSDVEIAGVMTWTPEQRPASSL